MREGSNSMTVCQPMVMMLVLPFEAELTSTIGPGSRKRRTWETGRSFLGVAFMGPSEANGRWTSCRRCLMRALRRAPGIVQPRGVERARASVHEQAWGVHLKTHVTSSRDWRLVDPATLRGSM